MKFFNMVSPSNVGLSTNFKQKAFVGSTVSLCMGMAALGTASFFGYNGRYMVSSAVSLVALLGAQQLIAKEPFPALLYQSSASHANTPLEHLRLLNNSPPTMSIHPISTLSVTINISLSISPGLTVMAYTTPYLSPPQLYPTVNHQSYHYTSIPPS
ncbi:hypothetical protein [Absidia glauca]|uniref:Uncharacterized protein n=1 Tax=Absidia glauca TaxID=4829 RepID=A0A163JJW0_ABSGL|nr:hypothetical protein [Absidia glauca]